MDLHLLSWMQPLGPCSWWGRRGLRLGEKLDWELGILSQSVRDRVKKKKAEKLAEEEYWSLKRSQGDFFSSIKNAEIEKKDIPYKVDWCISGSGRGKKSHFMVQG
ncbi:unnamed protein product [Lepidochelys olivacea]